MNDIKPSSKSDLWEMVFPVGLRRDRYAYGFRHPSLRPGTDHAFALAFWHVTVKVNLCDKDFLEEWTYGLDKLVL